MSRSILVRNSRFGVSVKEARKEHPPKEVLNSANIEGRDRRGLVQLLSYSCKNPCVLCVAVDDGWNDVLTVKSDKPLMKLT